MARPFVRVTLNTRQFLGQLLAAEGKVKRVSSIALNRIAFNVKKRDLPKGMDRYIDRPTPFTKRGGRVLKARARQEPQEAWVYMAPAQDRYLKPIVKGGVVRDNLPVPGGRARVNKYGNLPRGATKAKSAFHMKIRGVGHHVKRIGRKGAKKIHVIGSWFKYRFYRPSFPFFKVVDRSAQRNYNREYRAAWRRVFR
jgi:hypothetical protein